MDSNRQMEMLREVIQPETEPQFVGFPDPGVPLYSLSVERNSRGCTWKVSVGETGLPLLTALAAIDAGVTEMSARFGGIVQGDKDK